MRVSFLLLVCFADTIWAGPARSPERIVGGTVTTIDRYPFGTAVLMSVGQFFYQGCGGSILNLRSILTAAHCFDFLTASQTRFRVGSTWASSGGTVHNVAMIINHPNYNSNTLDNDFSILRSATSIIFINNIVQPASIAGINYNLADNEVVWAIGWGRTSELEPPSEQLRHVQIWTINQEICRQRYGAAAITDNMLCSGWLDVGGRDQCQLDSGGPLLHHNVVVGVCSFGIGCARPQFPGVNARVSSASSWIQANA